MEQRAECLDLLKEAAPQVAIWGAAGKGQVLSHAINPYQDVFAIDADPGRWGKFLEASGVQVHSPREATQIVSADTLILVSNPRHFEEIARYVDGSCRVLPADKDLPSLLSKLLGNRGNF